MKIQQKHDINKLTSTIETFDNLRSSVKEYKETLDSFNLVHNLDIQTVLECWAEQNYETILNQDGVGKFKEQTTLDKDEFKRNYIKINNLDRNDVVMNSYNKMEQYFILLNLPKSFDIELEIEYFTFEKSIFVDFKNKLPEFENTLNEINLGLGSEVINYITQKLNNIVYEDMLYRMNNGSTIYHTIVKTSTLKLK